MKNHSFKKQFSIYLNWSKYLFIMVFIFSFNKQVFSQCQEYPFLLDITGFTCGSTDGSVCFETTISEWVPAEQYGPCADYMIEITYNSTGFNFTPPPSFPVTGYTEIDNGNPNITLLRHIFPFIASGGYYGPCLEGTLNTPGTVFTLSLVNINDPNDVLTTTTFTLDQTVTIGNPTSPTNLTDWIAPNGPLLTSVSALNQSQKVIVNGTIIVNTGYKFSADNTNGTYSEIIMNPGAKIEVGGTWLFTLENTNVHGCGNQWDRILVRDMAGIHVIRSNISDATVALELEDDADIYVSGTIFSSNDIGIGAFGPAPYEGDIGLFAGSGSDGLFVNFLDGKEGIHLENSNQLVLPYGIFFGDMTENGVYLDDTDLTVDRNSFTNCKIGINIAEANSLLNVYGSSFYDCQTGIFTTGTEDLTVSGSDFTLGDVGIIRHTEMVNERSYVDNSSFAAGNGTGVLGNVLSSYGIVRNNNFLGNEYYNVRLNGLDPGQHAWQIHDNPRLEVSASGKSANVALRNIKRASIRRNDGIVSSNLFNFSISGGEANYIGGNFGDTYETNINLWGSPITRIICNVTTGKGIQVSNNSSGSGIYWNSMVNLIAGDFNLRYGTPWNTFANTGKQYVENVFDLSSIGSPKAVNYSDQFVAEFNQYIVGDITLSGSAVIQGDEYFPFFNSSFQDWFISEEGSVSECSNPPGGFTPEINEAEALENSIRNNIDILEGGLDSIYGAEVSFDAELKLFRHLSKFQQVGTFDTGMQNWYNSLAATDLYKFIQFEQLYQNAITYDDIETGQADQLSNDIKTLVGDINAIVWYAISEELTPVITIDEAQKAIREAKLSELEQKKSALSALMDTKQQQLANVLPNMTSINNSIGLQATISGNSLKTINGYLLQRYDNTFAGFNTADLQAISSIANQCVGSGGEAVYTARALLAEAGQDSDNYNDECIGGTQALVAPPENNTIQTAISLSPNPASQTATIKWPNDIEIEQMTVFDIYGRTIVHNDLEEGQTLKEINLEGWQSGMYFISFDNESIKPLKLIVEE